MILNEYIETKRKKNKRPVQYIYIVINIYLIIGFRLLILIAIHFFFILFILISNMKQETKSLNK